jgi:DUF2075 family protein
MIVYHSTKEAFIEDVFLNNIENIILKAFKDKLNQSTSKNEVASWKSSLMYMNNVLNDSSIPADCGVAIEYRIPQTSKRVDFILTGHDADKKDYAIIVELKQWSECELTDKDAIVKTYVGKAVRELSHPSYQAWSYAALLQSFNETVYKDNVQLKPCAYLHNYIDDGIITHSFYQEHIDRAPLYLRADALKLRNFIKQYVKYGDTSKIMYRIEHGRIKPSKSLADSLASMLKGNEEFVMVDEQKLVYETAMNLARRATHKKKHVLIVEGGPGTGKSVVAVNLLVQLTKLGLVCQYVTKNAAPRAVYESKLTGTFKKSHISNMFVGSGAFTSTLNGQFDSLIVDEAHRLNEKSGLFSNLGENQVKEIIHAAKFSVFFVDEDQKVTLKDVGDKDEIRHWAKLAGAEVTELELTSQFRCNGSDGYLAWLDQSLQIRETANPDLSGLDYEFKVFNSPTALKTAILEKNKANNKARLVAGYCWDWKSKSNPQAFDIEFPTERFAMRWNLTTDGSLWVVSPTSVNEIGCIHTCQGLEVDYVGVIVGPDLIVRNGKVLTDPSKRSKMDASIKGYKRLMEEDVKGAQKILRAIIKNTYRTLMTRGMKGCYVYFADKETEEYFIREAL